jgi:ABC-2 type transport system permease protein
MKVIRTSWAVMRKELRIYFLSPLAYVFLAAVLFLSGVFFSLAIAQNEEASLRSTISYVAVLLIFCVPLLTMRQLAEESRAGTFELLLTTPLPLSALIVGKWLATMVLCGALLLFLGAYVPVLVLYGDPDLATLLTSYLGLYCCCGAFSAAGLFASSLTRDSMMAGVLGVLILLPFWIASGALNFLPETTRVWLERASVLEHLRSFAQGTLDSGDLVWFAGFTGLFLFLTWRSIESRRWR